MILSKTCTRCQEPKRLTDYSLQAKGADGLQTQCKSCLHDIRLKKTYGISLAEYDDMLAKQQGGCAMCGLSCSSGRRMSVDHCHLTGAVRGLLCGNCNRGIGLLQDDPGLLRRGADYLEKHGS